MDKTDMRGPPLFVADDKALDFVNTLAMSADGPVDWIANGADLVAWLGAAGHLSGEEAAALLCEPAAALDRAAAEARALRHWFGDIARAHAGRPDHAVTSAQADRLNALLADDTLSWQLDPAGARRLHLARSLRDAGDLLRPVAESMARLLCEADFSRVRACEGAGCVLMFRDISKNGGRRWCSMAGCGNRAKAAQHRARRRAAD